MFCFCIYLTFKKDFAIKLSVVLTFELCTLVGLKKQLKRQKTKKPNNSFYWLKHYSVQLLLIPLRGHLIRECESETRLEGCRLHVVGARKILFLNSNPKLFSKVEWEADPLVFRLLSWRTNSQFGLRTQTDSKFQNWCLSNAEVCQMYLPLNWEFVFIGKRLIFRVIFLML